MSEHARKYILKGALALRAWGTPEFRPTMDIDMLGKTGNDTENITAHIRDILAVEIEPDGLTFDSNSIQTERITEDADYEGIRVRFRGALDTAKIIMQIDIGFGDVVYPEPEKTKLPCTLNFPAPSLLCYSRESAIAEKFEAMITLGQLNSRMKDFYDIWLLSRQFQFESRILVEAARLTFKQRGTEPSEPIAAFSDDFISFHQPMWIAFRERLNQTHIPESFKEIVNGIKIFLEPITKGVSDNNTWEPGGPWSCRVVKPPRL